ncbi:MAG: hypothetical protein CMN67_02490 [Sphingomonadaceae bacterium]|nr:hypothetical protein [Sphingomonadaceae bacterium]
MSIEIGNRLSRAGRIAESLSEYRKVPSKSPLFEQAQFNIKALESRLLNSGQEYDGEQFLEKSETKFLRVFNNECDNNWVAVITLWKRIDYLEEQLDAVFGQSVPPESVILIQNEYHIDIPDDIRSRDRIEVIQSGLNSLYTRWIVGYLANAKFVCVFDDDVIPGSDWIQSCIRTSEKHNALVGPSGRRAKPSETPAWESVETVGSDNDALCDWVCNSYFFQTEWIKYIVEARRYRSSHKTFDDIQLATTLKALGNINCVVPAQPSSDKRLNGHLKRKYGHDEHALWKRSASEHTHQRSKLVRQLDDADFEWCNLRAHSHEMRNWLSRVSQSAHAATTIRDKSRYIELISEHSFDVPDLSELRRYLDEIATSATAQLSSPSISQATLAIIFSVTQIKEFEELSASISIILENIYQSDWDTDLLDYVISNDWGKLLLLPDENLASIVRNLISDKRYNRSNEIAALVLKIATHEKGREVLRSAVGYDVFCDIYFDIVRNSVGRTGGLLRDAAFLTRRQPRAGDSASVMSADRVVNFFNDGNFDSVLKYSIASLIARSFSTDIIELSNKVAAIDKNAGEYLLMIFGGPYLAWSRILTSCLHSNIEQYEFDAINEKKLVDFYSVINKHHARNCNSNHSVGVIITTYNPDRDMLESSMTSILNQTHGSLKLCIVDDCSDLEYWEAITDIAENLNDDRLTVLRNNNNVGQYVSRNIAIEHLKGVDFIAIQDDDDVSHHQRIELQVRSMQNNPSVMLNMVKQARFTNEMKYVPDRKDPTKFDSSPASTMIRAEVIDEIGGFADVRSRGDVEFISRVRQAFGSESVYTIDSVLYLMRAAHFTVSASRDYFLKTQLDVLRKQMPRDHAVGMAKGAPHALLR